MDFTKLQGAGVAGGGDGGGGGGARSGGEGGEGGGFCFGFALGGGEQQRDQPQQQGGEEAERRLREQAAAAPMADVTADVTAASLLSDLDPIEGAVEIGDQLLLRKANVDDVDAHEAGGGGAEAAERGADLVPGVYEGGYKLWEGSVDLARYLHARESGAEAEAGGADAGGAIGGALRSARVLELGCGHALPALVAAHHGASALTLQDFNPEVLVGVTAPAIEANSQIFSSVDAAVRYVAGSWESAVLSMRGGEGAPAEVLHREGYDLVLGAELWYNEATMDTLATTIAGVLARDGARPAEALIAGKSHYFGVGGSSRGFTEAATKAGLRVTTVWRKADGASNVREILRLTLAEA